VSEFVGSFQTTVQELSTIIHHKLDAIMFLIENDGYEIERWVHGKEAGYNDIPQWKYDQLPDAFTPVNKASEMHAKSYKIKTRAELEALFEDESFSSGMGFHVSSLHCFAFGVPRLMTKAVCRNAHAQARRSSIIDRLCQGRGGAGFLVSLCVFW